MNSTFLKKLGNNISTKTAKTVHDIVALLRHNFFDTMSETATGIRRWYVVNKDFCAVIFTMRALPRISHMFLHENGKKKCIFTDPQQCSSLFDPF